MEQLVAQMRKPPPTAGEILVEDFLKPMGITQTEFAKRIGVTYARLNEIVNGKRGVSVDTALRLSKAFGTTSDLWLNIQRMTDLYEALHSPKAKDIARIKPIERGSRPPTADRSNRPRRIESR
jgi:addiction module HigA family antidote